MAEFQIFRNNQRNFVRVGIMDDCDWEPLVKLGLDFWYLGDRRVGGLVRRTFRIQQFLNKTGSVHFYLHRIVAIRVLDGKIPLTLQDIWERNLSLDNCGLLNGENFWDYRASNISFSGKGRGGKRVAVLAPPIPSVELNPSTDPFIQDEFFSLSPEEQEELKMERIREDQLYQQKEAEDMLGILDMSKKKGEQS